MGWGTGHFLENLQFLSFRTPKGLHEGAPNNKGRSQERGQRGDGSSGDRKTQEAEGGKATTQSA